jgi:hypothetical protein
MNFSDFSKAASAVQVPLANKPVGDSVAPQVFYFRPHNKWYLISQWGAKYSTNTDIANPDGWSAPKSLLSGGPSNGIDYWVICDSANCHLFFSGDDETLTINACNMQFLYQGVDPGSTASYERLPYRLGLIRAR